MLPRVDGNKQQAAWTADAADDFFERGAAAGRARRITRSGGIATDRDGTDHLSFGKWCLSFGKWCQFNLTARFN